MIRLAPLHLDHRTRLRGEHPEVGEHVGLPRCLELLASIVIAGLVEDVGLDPNLGVGVHARKCLRVASVIASA